jgi:short-subunit dehydrogenase
VANPLPLWPCLAWAQISADAGWTQWTRGLVELALSRFILRDTGAMVESFEATRIEDFTWLMNINFWGIVHGTQAFLPYLKQAADGHVINTSSLFGLLAAPGTSAYHATKFAVRGYTESLRQELDMMKCGVSATCVLPGGIKTAIAENARRDENIAQLGMDPRTSKEKFSRNLITSAERAAAIILKAVQHNKRRVLVGRDAIVLDKVQRLLPSGYAAIVGMLVRRTYQR